MKRFFNFILGICLASTAFAQSWSGTTPGDIFYNSGKVGIGTSTPTHLLHLKNGSARMEFNSIYSFDPIIDFKNESDGADVSQYFYRWSGTTNQYWGTRFTRSVGEFKLQMALPAPLGAHNFINALTITNAGSIAYSNDVIVDLSQRTGADGRDANFTKISPDNSVGVFLVEREGPEVAEGFAFWNKDLNSAIAKLGMTTGYVTSQAFGIGTTIPDPAFRLSVNGIIRAKEIKVETGWSDYVFAPDYALRSLGEVEKFISENRHLPGIPSATEVQGDGILLGEMNAKLLEKIEELTLYLIEQNKQLANQQQEIENLKLMLNQLKKP